MSLLHHNRGVHSDAPDFNPTSLIVRPDMSLVEDSVGHPMIVRTKISGRPVSVLLFGLYPLLYVAAHAAPLNEDPLQVIVDRTAAIKVLGARQGDKTCLLVEADLSSVPLLDA